jgi:pyruvate kinase
MPLSSIKKTKIVATISDKTCTEEFIRDLYEKGMNIVRLNTAHQTHDDALKVVEMARKVSDKIALLLDTKGPEIRTNKMAEEKPVKVGEIIKMKGEPDVPSDEEMIRVSYAGFVEDLQVGSKILIDDGILELEVVAKEEDHLNCKVMNNGVVQGRKSINIPSTMIKLPALTEKDIDFIRFAAKHDLDFIAHSFVRRAEDVIAVQAILDAAGSDMKIIAKIENQEGVENLDEILPHVYGVMVARGDLAIEISAERIPVVQREMVRKCRQQMKPVIVATQMLHSMIENPRPTRAEVSDVANAIYDGADAVMLSGETAYGKYPGESVAMMTKIAHQVESELPCYMEGVEFPKDRCISQHIVKYAVDASANIDVKAIIADTTSGATVRALSAHRSKKLIFAQCYNKQTMRSLALSWGVYADFMEPKEHHHEFVTEALWKLESEHQMNENDIYIIVAGSFGRQSGTTFIEISKSYLLKKKYGENPVF